MKRIQYILVLSIWSTALFAPANTEKKPELLEKIPELLKDKQNIIPVAIIGGGPAGLSAAMNPARSGYHTVVFQGPKPGGELNDSEMVENWPAIERQSGAEVMRKLEKQVSEFGAHLVPLVIDDIDFKQWPFKIKLNNGTTAYALTVIICTGSTQRKLGIEGEHTYWGKGLFSCGLCDGSFTKDKSTVIIGGGDIAVQRALQLFRDAKDITMIVPGPHMTAHQSMQDKLKDIDTISFLYNKEIKEIAGTEKDITHVVVYDTVTKETSTVPTTSVFLSTELTPNTELFHGKLPIDKNGCIKLKNSKCQQTSVEGVMAAGTVSDPTYRQVAAINGDGTKAGMDALTFLSQWEFDGQHRTLASTHLYIPPTIPHPLIKKLATMVEFNRLLQERKPLLLEVYSPSCPSCKKMDGPLSAIMEEHKDTLTVYKLDKDIDSLYGIIEKYNVDLIPALLLFRDGQKIDTIAGEKNLTELQEFVKNGLKKKMQAPQTS